MRAYPKDHVLMIHLYNIIKRQNFTNEEAKLVITGSWGCGMDEEVNVVITRYKHFFFLTVVVDTLSGPKEI